jgi:hypothetical protein
VGVQENGSFDEHHLSTEQMRELLARHSTAQIFTTATLPDGIASAAKAQHVSTPISELVARVGAMKAAKHQFTPIDQIDANYVRADEGLYRTQ